MTHISRRMATGAAIGAALIAATAAVPVAGASSRHRSRHHTHATTLKTGTYDITTSPAIEAYQPTVTYKRYAAFFELFRVPWNSCGGPSRSTTVVYCLSTYADVPVGTYGTKSTTSDPTLCSEQGYPDSVEPQGWTPRVRLPANGRLAFNTVVGGTSDPTERLQVSVHITPAGSFTGTIDATAYITYDGATFPGCTTGSLSLKGRWKTPY